MELRRLVEELEITFQGNPVWKGHSWHGPSVMETLRGITSDQAKSRLPNSHSIVELVLHMAAWRQFVTEKLVGNNSFDVSDANNFPVGVEWSVALERLQQSQVQLLDALREFPESRLSEIVPQRKLKFTYQVMLQGLIHHDLYHTGQIALLKKLTAE